MKLLKPSKKLNENRQPLHISYMPAAYSGNVTSEYKKVLRKSGKNIRTVSIFLLIGILVVSIYYIIKDKSLFVVQNVSVQGINTFVNNDDVENISKNILLGKNVLTLNNKDVEDSLKNNFLGAENFKVTNDLYGNVSVEIIERSPVAILKNENSDKYLVDKEGYVMGYLSIATDSFPQIMYKEKISVGEFINPKIIPISSWIIDEAKTYGLFVSTIEFDDRDIYLRINDIDVMLSLDKDNDKSIQSISAIIKKSPPEGKNLRKVDLRFDKVIVLYD